jgi:hypothetical protein
MKLVAWFPSSLEDTRALAVVQDCSTATILESTGIYAPGFSPDRCREQGLSLPISECDNLSMAGDRAAKGQVAGGKSEAQTGGFIT